MKSPSIVERAYALAATGNYKTVREVREQLRREGHAHAALDTQLSGPAIRKSLREACVKAWTARSRQTDVALD